MLPIPLHLAGEGLRVGYHSQTGGHRSSTAPHTAIQHHPHPAEPQHCVSEPHWGTAGEAGSREPSSLLLPLLNSVFPAIFFLQKTDLDVLGRGQRCVISQALFSTQYNLGSTNSHLASQEEHLQTQPHSNEKCKRNPAGQALHGSNKPAI